MGQTANIFDVTGLRHPPLHIRTGPPAGFALPQSARLIPGVANLTSVADKKSAQSIRRDGSWVSSPPTLPSLPARVVQRLLPEFLHRFHPSWLGVALMDAFEKADTPLKLVLAGGSSHTDGYVSRLRRHASERIRFLDWLSGDALEEILTNAALFVLPSDLEGLSLALLEAMGAGVCVLASDVPENCEVIEDTGFVFKAGDAADLQRMLCLLLSDPRMREIAGASAQQRVREHYLWGKVTKQLADVYADLMAPPQELPAKKPQARALEARKRVA